MQKIVILFLLMSTLLYAKSQYIKVTVTQSQNTLARATKFLNSIKMKSIYKTKRDGYHIYATPRNARDDINRYLAKIHKYFPKAYVISSKKPKQAPKKEEKVVAPPVKEQSHDNFFLSGAIGYSLAPTFQSESEGSIEIIQPNNTGISYSVGAGYRLDNTFDFALGYMVVNTDDLLFTNMYGEFNYRFTNKTAFTPYMGMLGGFSSLHWNSAPILQQASGSNNDSGSILFGTQIGGDYAIADNMLLFTSYQFMMMEQITNINVDNINHATLQHNYIHTLSFGLQLLF